ncbi:flagellar motor protein MotB [Bacillota bacterium]
MAKKIRRQHHEEELGEAWLLPYSDLMTLLLAVFIVLFAVSQVDAQKAQILSDLFSGNMMTEEFVEIKQMLKEEQKKLEEQETEEESTSTEGNTEIKSMEDLKREIDQMIEQGSISDFARTYIDNRGLIITMNNAILFDPGSGTIKEEYKTAMLSIARIAISINNHIRVEGHTDNVPMNSETYPSNWELSSARAISVVRLFIEESGASPEKFLAVGYGEYRPIADNSTEEGRAKNRRIDIIVLSEDTNVLEKQIL